MLKKFALWFTCFGLSFLVSQLGWAEQGKAFLYIHLGFSIVSILALIIILVLSGASGGFSAEANSVSILVVILAAAAFVITIFATWGATKLFDVNFYVAYQIMSFGQCLCVISSKISVSF